MEGTFVEVATGHSHACALADSGEVTCWGADDAGQVSGVPQMRFSRISGGDGYFAMTDEGEVRGTTAHYPPEEKGFVSLSVGGLEATGACAVDAKGALECWGEAASWPPPDAFAFVSVSNRHACGVTLHGDTRCWGCVRRRR